MNKLIHSGAMLLALLHPLQTLANETLFLPPQKT
jgi:porin